MRYRLIRDGLNNLMLEILDYPSRSYREKVWCFVARIGSIEEGKMIINKKLYEEEQRIIKRDLESQRYIIYEAGEDD